MWCLVGGTATWLESKDVATWHASRDDMLQRVDGLLRAAGTATHRRTLVVVEDNFQLRSMRKQYIQLARTRTCSWLRSRLGVVLLGLGKLTATAHAKCGHGCAMGAR